MTRLSHSITVLDRAERKDVVFLELKGGARVIATGDITKGIKVPPGAKVEKVEFCGGCAWSFLRPIAESLTSPPLRRDGCATFDLLTVDEPPGPKLAEGATIKIGKPE